VVVEEEDQGVVRHATIGQLRHDRPHRIVEPEQILPPPGLDAGLADAFLQSLARRQYVRSLVQNPLRRQPGIGIPRTISLAGTVRNGGGEIEEEGLVVVAVDELQSALRNPVQIVHGQCSRTVAVRVVVVERRRVVEPRLLKSRA
jgi:hypothetical protein